MNLGTKGDSRMFVLIHPKVCWNQHLWVPRCTCFHSKQTCEDSVPNLPQKGILGTKFKKIIDFKMAVLNRVFVFPGPQPFAWTLVLAPNHGPKFVFTSSGAKFLFTGPGTKFVFTSPGPQFVFTCSDPQFVFTSNLYLPSQPGLSLYITTLSPQFVFTGPGLWFVCTQAAKLIYPQRCWIM